jgi:ornithine carbamoyltransferase
VTRHLLEIDDLTPAELLTVLDLAEAPAPPQVLAGKGMALLFEKPSLRTRNATEMAAVQLGGHPISISADEVGLDTRETAEDISRVLGRFHAVVAARVFEHSKLERMAAVSPVPIVNLLSDLSHPMQAFADLLTIRQRFGGFEGRTVAYVGDGNNVARSLAFGCAMVGMDVRLGCPVPYRNPEADIDRVRALGGSIEVLTRPEEAVEDADVVYTDVWASMGQETEAQKRRAAFEGFTVDRRLMEVANEGALFLHCLPAHRGEEVSAEVLEGPASDVWRQAENRMHAARGLLVFLLTETRA